MSAIDLLAIDLDLRADLAARTWRDDLAESLGRPVTGDDIRAGIGAGGGLGGHARGVGSGGGASVTARATVLPPAPRPCIPPPREADRDTDVEPLSGYRHALADIAREHDDGVYYELPCGCDAEHDCPECAPSLYVGDRRIEEP